MTTTPTTVSALIPADHDVFAAFLAFVTIRGLHPVAPLPLALFGPLVVIYGWVLERSWYRVRLLSPATDANVAT